MSASHSLPRLNETAFFFDFDGTLAPLAPTPDAVQVAEGAIAALQTLQTATGGAVAIVSGRPIHEIDRFLAPLALPIAGSHGAEMRRGAQADSEVVRIGFGDPRLEAMRVQLEPMVAAQNGLLLEVKGAGLAVHYRAAPQLQSLVEQVTTDVVRAANAAEEAFVLQPGKMVVEIKPHGVDKGRAIELFLEQAPFAGRKPFFVGDDLTDEKGFKVVNARGGLSVKIGEGDSIAGHREPSVEAFVAWLKQLVDQ
ncbi:trehalose-phosphatase [Robbsia sp. KACC 23696]|uniref:trehalose-phosphatase n=1 Tax=Robbsia sp. KACC 23696 TaxID=3149231 RepID=UPI00325A56DA